MSAQGLSPSQVAQGQLDAYNAQDLDGFCRFYANDVVVADLNGTVTQQGLADLRERYARMFLQHPQNRAELVNRIALGNVVADHEHVVRGPGGETFDVMAIYTIRGGRIARVDFVK